MDIATFWKARKIDEVAELHERVFLRHQVAPLIHVINFETEGARDRLFRFWRLRHNRLQVWERTLPDGRCESESISPRRFEIEVQRLPSSVLDLRWRPVSVSLSWACVQSLRVVVAIGPDALLHRKVPLQILPNQRGEFLVTCALP